jgi:mannose-6-phosphate isomerase-like protein (cupin superfamily)
MRLENIHKDHRGSIFLLLDGIGQFCEVTIFKTNRGAARGGCVHNIHDEFCCVIDGEVKYVIGEKICFLSAGRTVMIKKGTPHYFISTTDSIVMEWGASSDEKKNKHPRFRAIVDSINKGKL